MKDFVEVEDSSILKLSADIVSAQARAGKVETPDIPSLIQSVHHALASAGSGRSSNGGGLSPRVAIEASVQPERIYCLDCGASMKMLKRHLNTEHSLTPEDYRNRWNLPADYPLVAPLYSKRRAELAKESGLGRKR